MGDFIFMFLILLAFPALYIFVRRRQNKREALALEQKAERFDVGDLPSQQRPNSKVQGGSTAKATRKAP